MKKIITIIASALLIISCSPSKEEQMIIDYEAKGMKEALNINIDDTDFKVNSVVKDAEIKANDSLKIVQEYFDEKKAKKIRQFQSSLDTYSGFVKDYEEKIKKASSSMKKFYQENIDKYKKDVKREEDNIALYNGDCKGTFLEPVLAKINSYKANPEKILSNKYKANTSMTNPLLKVKQTFDNYYYTDASGTKFIKKETIK